MSFFAPIAIYSFSRLNTLCTPLVWMRIATVATLYTTSRYVIKCSVQNFVPGSKCRKCSVQNCVHCTSGIYCLEQNLFESIYLAPLKLLFNNTISHFSKEATEINTAGNRIPSSFKYFRHSRVLVYALTMRFPEMNMKTIAIKWS